MQGAGSSLASAAFMRRTLGSLLLPLLALCLLHGTAMAQGKADRPDVRELLERDRCQTSLPGADDATGTGDGSGTGDERRGDRRAPRRERRFFEGSGGGIGGGVAQLLLWTAVGGATVLLLIAIVRGVRERGRVVQVRAVAPRIEGVGPATTTTPDTMPDHERLAAAGDFAAALHAVLARAIVRWIERFGALPTHCTARGVLRRIRADQLERSAFAGMVAAAESVRFAGRGADRSTYETARGHLQQWEAACHPNR